VRKEPVVVQSDAAEPPPLPLHCPCTWCGRLNNAVIAQKDVNSDEGSVTTTVRVVCVACKDNLFVTVTKRDPRLMI
jgi:hypothetical protein